MRAVVAGLAAAAVVLAACSPSITEPSPPADDPRLAWYQIEAQERDDRLAAIVLRTGYEDGMTTAEVPVPFDVDLRVPRSGIGFTSGPAGGLVVLGLDDGATSRVTAIEVADGSVTDLLATDDPIVGGTLHPSGDRLFLLLTERGGGGLRIEQVDPTETHEAGAPVPLGWSDQRALERSEYDALWATPDGRLLVQRCLETTCRYQVVDPDTGAGRVIEPPGTGDVVGLTDDFLLAHPNNWTGMAKTFVLVDLETGIVRDLRLEASRATLLLSGGQTLIALESTVGAGSIVHLVDVGGAVREKVELRDIGGHVQLVQAPEQQGLPVPAGWFVMGDEGRIAIDGPTDDAPLLVEVASGRQVRFRNLHPLP